jgi:hypothetical protein
MLMKRSLVVVLVVAALPLASAQWTNYTTWNTFNNPISSFLDTVITGNMRMNAMAARFAESGSSPAYEAMPLRTATFTPLPYRLVVEDVAAAYLDDPAGREQIAELLQIGLETYEAFALDEGRPHDVALAFTFFVVTNYMIATGMEPPDAGVEALLHAVDLALSDDDAFAAAGDADRQALYEFLVATAMFTTFGAHAGAESGDADIIEAFRILAGESLESVLGVELTRTTFTSAGLIIR